MAKVKGGDKARKVLENMGANLKKGRFVKVGFLRGATYPDGTPVAMIGLIQDFGAPSVGIPPRPFFRNAVADHKNDWGRQLGEALIKSKLDADKALTIMGGVIKGQIEESITDGSYAPLAPATIRRKGFSTPLVDTAHMRNSVKYEVVS